MFRKLLVKALLEKAITYEEKAYRFYESAIERTALSENAELLKKLLAEELRHRIKLEEAQSRGDLEVMNRPSVRRAGRDAASGETVEGPSACGEVPAGARGGVAPRCGRQERTGDIPREWPSLHPWAGRDEILGLALMKETSSCAFYRDLASKSRVKAARELFDALAREEAAHVEWLRAAVGKGPERGASS